MKLVLPPYCAPTIQTLRCAAVGLTSFRTSITLLFLLFAVAPHSICQCPPRPQIPDPPGWSIDHVSGIHILNHQLSSDGNWVAFNSDGAIELLNVQRGDRRTLIPCIEVSTQAMAFTSDSSTLAVGSGNGVIYVFDVRGGRLRAELRDEDWVQELAFGPRGLLIAHRSDGISIWDTTSLQRVAAFYGGTCVNNGPCVWQFLDSADLSPDGKFLATAGRENSGILVRDLSGSTKLWIKDTSQIGPFLFVPGTSTELMVSRPTEFVFWDVETRHILRRVPHAQYVWADWFLPGSSTIVVQKKRNGNPDSEDIQRINISTGNVVSSSHVAALLSWVSPEGTWATSYSREIINVPTGKVISILTYVRPTGYVATWKVSYDYLTRRILVNQVPPYLMAAGFLLLGTLGYWLCRAHWLAVVPTATALLPLSIWLAQELFWPLHGPPLARAIGGSSLAASVGAMLAAYMLVARGLIARYRNQVPSTRTRRLLRLCVPTLATTLSVLLMVTASAQWKVEKERFQIEGDLRSGGELHGSALMPWYTRNFPAEVHSTLSNPALIFSSLLCHTDRTVGRYSAEVVSVFALWWLIGGVVFPPAAPHRLRRNLLVAVLAGIEVVAAGAVLIPYIVNPVCRAYTPSSQLLSYLAWACCLVIFALRSFVRTGPSPWNQVDA